MQWTLFNTTLSGQGQSAAEAVVGSRGIPILPSIWQAGSAAHSGPVLRASQVPPTEQVKRAV